MIENYTNYSFFEKIKVIEPRTYGYKRKNDSITGLDIWGKTTPQGNSIVFLRCHDGI